MDMTQCNTSIYINLKVVNDVKKSGGIWVHLTFTFPAANLFALLLITVIGLTSGELCPIEFPYGIMTARLNGIGKKDIEYKIWSMMYFLREDMEESNNEN